MYKIAIGPSSFADKDRTPLKMLREKNVDILSNPYGRRLTEEEIIEHIKDADGLIAGLEPLNRKVLSSTTKLKAIARVGIGMDNIDLKAAHELGVIISYTPDGPTYAVAEMTVASMLSLCRQLQQMNDSMHNGNWNKVIGTGMINTDVLIIGYGRIGRTVGNLLKPFKPNIFVYDPLIKADELSNGEILVSLEEGLAKASIITLHASGNDMILDREAFDKMQNGTILLNSARAELIDQNALIHVLSNGKLDGAWLDVFWEEPYHGELLKFPNVILTPHVGTYTKQCRLDMESEAVKNLFHDLKI